MSELIKSPSVAHPVSSFQHFFESEIQREVTLNISIREIHRAIIQVRSIDLGELYSLDSDADILGFLGWCVTNGVKEYSALVESAGFIEDLMAPACNKESEWSGGISKHHVLISIARPDLNIISLCENESEQLSFLSWFWFNGGFLESEISSNSISKWERSYWINSEFIEDCRFSKLLFLARPDIAQNFDLNSLEGRLKFRWWIDIGQRERFLYDLPVSCLKHKDRYQEAPKFGVNLIGYAKGDLGIGEDVRMAAVALSAAGIPFVIIDFSPGGNVSENNNSAMRWISVRPLYFFNIVCLTALEHLRCYLEQGEKYFLGRYTIGYWPWELENWPPEWANCFNLVDEIWSSSRYTFSSISKAFQGKMECMPMTVIVPDVALSREEARSKYGIPLKGKVFVFSFDGNSTIARKNPLAIVLSFKMAFPEAKDVYLLIKSMRMDYESAEWIKIKEIAVLDKRILIRNELYSRNEVVELYSACDCFVSLHRAEGFGRGIAEAFLLGLQVIATNYGGNIDFCSKLPCGRVSYKKIPVADGQYVGSENQYWAEPSVFDASQKMRDFVNESQDSKPRLSSLLENIFSPRSIGASYFKRLKKIACELGVILDD